jgi:hypothetical protein
MLDAEHELKIILILFEFNLIRIYNYYIKIIEIFIMIQDYFELCVLAFILEGDVLFLALSHKMCLLDCYI